MEIFGIFWGFCLGFEDASGLKFIQNISMLYFKVILSTCSCILVFSTSNLQLRWKLNTTLTANMQSSFQFKFVGWSGFQQERVFKIQYNLYKNRKAIPNAMYTLTSFDFLQTVNSILNIPTFIFLRRRNFAYFSINTKYMRHVTHSTATSNKTMNILYQHCRQNILTVNCSTLICVCIQTYNLLILGKAH
ncbi:Hypothetical_protein [Hexamita inflata]|uniref:Hypothetical_protein n=1 Tax=Hexamita inflata TaxID=28002 RepID=A0ABP1HQN8_9EUKA